MLHCARLARLTATSDGLVRQVMFQSCNTRQREPVNPESDRGTGTTERSGNVADAVPPMQHQHGSQPAGIIFIVRFMDCFLHQASFVTGNRCYDRHRSVRLVIMVGLAIVQIAQSGLSSLKVICYSAQLFSVIKTWIYNETPLLKHRFYCDNHHKTKAILYGGFCGGSACEKYQQKQ